MRKGVFAEYGVSQAEFNSLANRITAIVIKPKFDHNPNMSLENRAKTIQDAVVEEMERSLPGNQKPVLVERMVLQDSMTGFGHIFIIVNILPRMEFPVK